MCISGMAGLLVWIIIVCAIVAIVRVAMAYAPVPAVVVQILNIVLWAVVAIACVYVRVELLVCIIPLPRLR